MLLRLCVLRHLSKIFCFQEFAETGKLILPSLQGKQMEQVIVTLTITNRIDRVLAERGFISSGFSPTYVFHSDRYKIDLWEP